MDKTFNDWVLDIDRNGTKYAEQQMTVIKEALANYTLLEANDPAAIVGHWRYKG